METFEEAREKILAELTSDDPDVRAEYLQLFEPSVKIFSSAMAQAYMKWCSFRTEAQDNEKRAPISALVFTAIRLHILSMELFLSGHLEAAGNLTRQVIEAMSLALVCSGKDQGIFEKFMEAKYSTNVAVRDVVRHAEKLGLNADAVKALRNTQNFYHKYSHLTPITVAIGMSFSGGGLNIGATFDEGKVKAYTKEASLRVNLAKIFPNFVDGIMANVAKW